jgi:mono/diheme cytochrome c family protein
MSEHKPEKTVQPPRAFGWMAEYADEHQLLDAARKVRDSGYTRTDAFTPFPVHGIDEALGIKPTVLPWFTLVAGAAGTSIAITMQVWMNAIDYPYIISGKPFISLPAFIPVAFELTVLFAAFTTVFAMLGLNGLPRFSNPLFTNPKFDRTTDDRFFLWVDSRDKYFNSEKVKGLLEETHALEVQEVREDDSPAEIPKALLITIFTLILMTLIPGAIVLNMRATKSGSPRLHVFFDMDFQPKRKTQTTTTLFADSRVQRPPVPGTIARGELDASDPYYLGFDPDATAALLPEGTRFVGLIQDPPGDDHGDADPPELPPAVAAMDSEENYVWLTEFPLPVNAELFELGRRKYEQNCSVCHGFGGYGDGLVAQRAAALAQGYWLPPTSLHDSRILEQPVGRIYYTVANGKGKMGGYASSLSPKERWAVVLYVRGLQRSQNARETDIPPGITVAAENVSTAE